MFCQRLNARTGKVEWVHVLAEPAEGEVGGDDGDKGRKQSSEELVESLNAHSTYIEMLNDGGRNEAYRRALESVLRPGDRILDIGTGTGLLALLAAKTKAGQDEQTSIIACEVYPPMVRISKKIISMNDLDDKIQVVGKRSDELKIRDGDNDDDDYGRVFERFDVIVTEIFDSELLGEGLLPTLRHAVHHLLPRDGDKNEEGEERMIDRETRSIGRIIPAKARVFVQLVHWKEAEVGIGSDRLELETAFLTSMSPVSAPGEAFAFSLLDPPQEKDKGPAIQLQATEANTNAATTGCTLCHGVLLWWQLRMDDVSNRKPVNFCSVSDPEEPSENYLSTAPPWIKTIEEGGDERKDRWVGHWKQVFLPWAQPVHLKVGESVTLQAQVGDTHFKIQRLLSGDQQGISGGGGMNQLESFQTKYLRESLNRTLFVKSEAARSTYVKAIRTHFNSCCLLSAEWTVVVTGNSLWLVEILMLEFSVPNVVWVCDEQEQIYFKKLVARRRLGKRVNVQPLTQMESFLRGARCLLVAEPYFQFLDGHLPWSHWLHFAYIRQSIKDVCAEVRTIPFEAKLKGAAADFPYLWQGRKAVQSIAGINLHLDQAMATNQSTKAKEEERDQGKGNGKGKGEIRPKEICFDMFQAFHLSSYQGNHRLLSEACVLSETDLIADSDSSPMEEEEKSVKITQSGRVNCFLIWVEATLVQSEDSDLKVNLQTGPGTFPNYSLWQTAAALAKDDEDAKMRQMVDLTAGETLKLRTRFAEDFTRVKVSLRLNPSSTKNHY